MTRRAFRMKLKKGCELEYKLRHDALWPEMLRELEAAGVSDYSIFLDEETSTLFAFQKRTDHRAAGASASTAVVRAWWAHMADIMETNSDQSPIAAELVEVFHMD